MESCCASDELKHILGAETMRRGLLRVFEMFQHRQLNRRLLFVIIEGLLETLYPRNRLHQLFLRLHGRSPRLHAFHQRFRQQWPASHAARTFQLARR